MLKSDNRSIKTRHEDLFNELQTAIHQFKFNVAKLENDTAKAKAGLMAVHQIRMRELKGKLEAENAMMAAAVKHKMKFFCHSRFVPGDEIQYISRIDHELKKTCVKVEWCDTMGQDIVVEHYESAVSPRQVVIPDSNNIADNSVAVVADFVVADEIVSIILSFL